MGFIIISLDFAYRQKKFKGLATQDYAYEFDFCL